MCADQGANHPDMDMRRHLGQDRGFTLVELLVVIMILGVLMAIVVPSFLSQQDKAKDAKAQTQVTVAAHALKGIWTSNGQKLPDDATTLADQLANSEPELTPIGTDASLCEPDTVSLERVDDDDINIQTGSDNGTCFRYAAHFRGKDERLKSDGSTDTPWNLADDPNFDHDTVGDQPFSSWSAGDTDPSVAYQITVDGSEAQSSPNSLRVQTVPGESDSGANIAWTGSDNQTYTCSAYVKAGPGDAGASARIDYDVNDGHVGMHNVASRAFTLSSGWQRVSVTGANLDQTYSNRCGIHPANGSQPAFTLFVDSVMINSGSSPLPYLDGDNGGTWLGEVGKSVSVGQTPTQTWVAW